MPNPTLSLALEKLASEAGAIESLYDRHRFLCLDPRTISVPLV